MAGSAEKPSSIGVLAVPGKLPLNSLPYIVLDTNVVLDWFVFDNPGMKPAARAIEGGLVHWLGCPQTRGELAHVLEPGELGGRHVDSERVLTRVDRLIRIASSPDVLPLQRLRCTDPGDQMFIDLALFRQARWLLSRDRAVLKLARRAARQGLQILTPEAWNSNDIG